MNYSGPVNAFAVPPRNNVRGECLIVSERELHAKLDAPAVPAGDVLAEPLVDLFAGGIETGHGIDTGSGSVRAAELSVIERIVGLEAELHRARAFVPLEVL